MGEDGNKKKSGVTVKKIVFGEGVAETIHFKSICLAKPVSKQGSKQASQPARQAASISQQASKPGSQQAFFFVPIRVFLLFLFVISYLGHKQHFFYE